MKIVVLDGYTENPGDLSWDDLKALGDLTVYDRTAADQIVNRIGDAEAVYTNKTPISAETLAACPNLKFIGVLATGYNIVDVSSAKEHGVVVSNIPTYGTDAVGQFAIAMLLEICHHIGHHDQAVHQGRWENNQDWCFWDYPLIELAGKNMGIIGFGRIGRTTARIAKALGMNILAYDAYRPDDRLLEGYQFTGLDNLLSQSDVISLHCPPIPGNTRVNQSGHHLKNEGWGYYFEQQPRAADCRTGSCRCFKFRQSVCSRAGCGFYRAH